MYGLIPGTVVSVAVGPITHFGIVSDRQSNGLPHIISCSRRTGQVAEESAAAFANGGKIKVHGYPGERQPLHVMQKARSALGTKYDLFKWNCEHFVRWAHELKPESPQLLAAMIIGLIGLGLILRKSKLA